MLLVLMIVCAFLVPVGLAAQSLAGTWHLVRVTIPDPEDTNPSGILNVKEHYTSDGRLCVIPPDGALTAQTPCFPYALKGSTRTVSMPDGESFRAQVSFSDENTLVVRQEMGDLWSYRRLQTSDAPNSRLEPVSVEEFSGGDGTQVSYASAPVTSMPLSQRLLGTWEEVAHCGVSPHDAPPYGFFNNLWTFSPSVLVHTIRRGRTSEREEPKRYAVKDSTLQVGETSTLSVTFNEWGHLVLGQGEQTVILKYLANDTTAPSALPTLKIALLSLRGEKCDL
jgi:hypothetical protein